MHNTSCEDASMTHMSEIEGKMVMGSDSQNLGNQGSSPSHIHNTASKDFETSEPLGTPVNYAVDNTVQQLSTPGHLHMVSIAKNVIASSYSPASRKLDFCFQIGNGTFIGLLPHGSIGLFNHTDPIDGWESVSEVNSNNEYIIGSATGQTLERVGEEHHNHAFDLAGSSCPIAFYQGPNRKLNSPGTGGMVSRKIHTHFVDVPCWTNNATNEPPFHYLSVRRNEQEGTFAKGLITFQVCWNIEQCEDPPLGWTRYERADDVFLRGTDSPSLVGTGGGSFEHSHDFVCRTGGSDLNIEVVPSVIGTYDPDHYHNFSGTVPPNTVTPRHVKLRLIQRQVEEFTNYTILFTESKLPSSSWNCFGVSKDDAGMVCSGNGICESSNVCNCFPNYHSVNCNITTCDLDGIVYYSNNSLSCGVHGECIDFQTCKCENHWFGKKDICNITKCNNVLSNDSVVCSSHGECNDFETCKCTIDVSNSEWYGEDCNITKCGSFFSNDTENVCSNHGDCIDFQTCVCDMNWSRWNEDCEITSCFGVNSNESEKVCSKHGTCMDFNHCDCDGNYYGVFCNITKCNNFYSNETADVCSNHGDCKEFEKCDCDEFYFGEECNITTCNNVWSNDTSSVCFEKGICTIFEQCECYENYFGENCNITKCDTELSNFTSTCTEFGTCWPYDICTCDPGYFGESCNVTTCFGVYSNTSDICSEYGVCWPEDVCECDNTTGQYFGPDCNYTWCNNNPTDAAVYCSDHGTCWPYEQCNCVQTYYGEDCNITMCDGYYSNDTANVCTNHGKCGPIFEECHCDEFYFGDNCNVTTCNQVYSNDSNACTGPEYGTCTFYEKCDCLENYYGEDCNVTKCDTEFSNITFTCTEFGTCWPFDMCQCDEGYFGESCNVTTCFGVYSNTSDICSEYGVCWPEDVCECDNTTGQYFGPDCNYTWCNGNPTNTNGYCSDQGECWPFEVCNCDQNYYGEDCNLTMCNGFYTNETADVCSNHGTCLEFEKCKCDEFYFGKSCNVTTCNNVLSNDTTVCFEKGTCTIYEQCKCYENYFGENCNITRCETELSNLTSTCTEFGTCWPLDTCQCDPGYFGESCNVTTCFGVYSNYTSDVCTEHGICWPEDVCTCDNSTGQLLYFGHSCNYTWCNGKPTTDSTTSSCSEHGTCWPYEHCNCDSNYYGVYCNVTTCFNDWNNVTSTGSLCSGRGTCEYFDGCKCEDGYYGDSCNITTCFSIFSNDTVNVCSGNGICFPKDDCDCYELSPSLVVYEPPECRRSSSLSCVGLSVLGGEIGIAGSIIMNFENVNIDHYISKISIMDLETRLFPPVLFGDETENDITIRLIDMRSHDDYLLIGKSESSHSSFTRLRGEDGFIIFSYKLSEDDTIRDIRDGVSIGDLLYLLGTVDGGIHVTQLVSFGAYIQDIGYKSDNGNLEAVRIISLVDDDSDTDDESSTSSVVVLGKTDRNLMLLKMLVSTNNLTTGWIVELGRNGTVENPTSTISVSEEDDSNNFHLIVVGEDENRCIFLYKIVPSDVYLPENMIICHKNTTEIELHALDVRERINEKGYLIVGYLTNHTTKTKTGMIISVNRLFDTIESAQLFEETERFTKIESLNDRMIVLGESSFSDDKKCKIIEFLGTDVPRCVGDHVNDIQIPSTEFDVFKDVEMNVTERQLYNYSTNSFPTEISWFSDIPKSDNNIFNITNQSCGLITECYGYSSVNPLVCSEHGDCVDFNLCDCFTNYTIEEDCSYFTCFGVPNNDSSQVCSNHGVCESHDFCDCSDFPGYFGSKCEKWVCGGILKSDIGNVCSGNGSCVEPDVCDCVDGYFGYTCEFMGCFGISHDDHDNVCGNHGECIGPNTCDCVENYTLSEECVVWECFGVMSNDSENTSGLLCSGNGNCSSNDFCECELNYTSSDCSVWYCNETEHSDFQNNVCSGHGNCTFPEVCECEESFYGDFCQHFSTVCFGIQKNESGEVCGGHGKCIGLDICVCDDGYDNNNADCSVWECFGKLYNATDEACFGNGECVAPNNCSCDDGYGDVSEECETFSCFGILENNGSSVCGGHGNCTSYETCECEFGYDVNEDPPDCSTWNCNGVVNTFEGVVCSGHGSCISLESCVCDSDSYEGDNCEKWKCFNVSSNLGEEVCSGHGSCIDLDTCFCGLNGYNGSECNDWECIPGVNRTDPVSCNYRGNCVSPRKCECFGGFEGDLCDTFSCGGIDHKNPKTCNSRGTCLAPDMCICNRTNPEETIICGIYGDVCGMKVGKMLVRTTKKVLVMYLEISDDDLREIAESLMEETFPCNLLFNGSESTRLNGQKEVFRDCEVTNNNQFLEVSGSSVFLKVYISHFSDSEFETLLVKNKGVFEIFIGGKAHQIQYFQSVSERKKLNSNDKNKNKNKMYTIRNYRSDREDETLQTCKSKLHIGDQCFVFYECMPSMYTTGDLVSEENKNYPFYSIGYMPIPGTSSYGFSKHYFEDEESCEKGKFEKFLMFSPQRCFGSSTLRDNFVVYERCSSDLFSVLSEFVVVEMFAIATIPMALVFFVLLCFGCCCTANLMLYCSRVLVRKAGRFQSSQNSFVMEHRKLEGSLDDEIEVDSVLQEQLQEEEEEEEEEGNISGSESCETDELENLLTKKDITDDTQIGLKKYRIC